MWCALWREDGSVVYKYSWLSPAQSFSGHSPVGLATIFYCLRSETSIFIASYDSQGYDGGIRPRHQTGWTILQSQSYFTTGGLPPISSSWHRTPWESSAEFFFQLNTCGHCPCVTSTLTRGWVCRLQLLLALVSAFILRSESRRTHDHIYCLTFETSSTWSPGPRIYIPQEHGGPVIHPGTWFPFSRLLRLAGLRWR
jgi:hypothetical protein